MVSVRFGVDVPSALLDCQRVFQNTSLPLKKARLTPASRAASMFWRSAFDQYSSCALEMISLWLSSSPGLEATSGWLM